MAPLWPPLISSGITLSASVKKIAFAQVPLDFEKASLFYWKLPEIRLEAIDISELLRKVIPD